MTLDQLITYALSVYLLFHVAARAELLAAPRRWVLRTLPAKLTYPLSCSLCWSWWFGVLVTLTLWWLTGTLVLSASVLLAAPVLNMVLDMVVTALRRANEPPVQATLEATTGTLPAIVSIPSIWQTPGQQSPETPITYQCTSFSYADPQPQHVGRRARVARGRGSCLGHIGTITRHWIDNDDCSGTFRKECYTIEGASHHAIPAADCDLLDEPTPPASPAT